MKQLDIRFTQERERRRAEQQLKVIAQLQEKLPERIAEQFDDVHVRIRFSSAAGAEVTGFKDKEERKRFMTFLEELWADDSLMELDN